LAFYACKPEDSFTNNSDWNRTLSPEVLKAKAWFDNYGQKKIIGTSEDGIIPTDCD
jgi:hypothetical protein